MTYSFALLQNFNDLITKLIPKSGFILTRLPYNTLVIQITEELKIMSEVERKQIEAIKKSYVPEEKADKMKELLRLNAAVSRPALSSLATSFLMAPSSKGKVNTQK